MKNPLKKTGRLGIVLMLVFGLFLSSCKKEIYPSLKKDLLGYQGSNPIVQDVIAELKKPQHNELLRRLGQHGSINWNDPKILLTTSFPDGLSMRFYSADSNYFDARINAQTKAIQLLDRTQLQTEAAQANAQMQQASIAKAKQMGRKTTSNTDPNWPLCNQPGAEGMCQQTIDAELEIRDPFYDLDLSNREQVYSFVQTKLFYGDFFAHFSLALRNRGYERYVYGAKWINPREVKTRQEIIFDLWDAYAEAIYRWNYLKLPQTVVPKMKILWVEPGSTCCPAPQKPVGVLEPIAKDIGNRTTDPCISKTVDAVLKANNSLTGALAGIIQKFDTTKSVSINIYDGNLYNDNGSPKAGQTTNQKFVGSNFSANITLGKEFHLGTSKESLVTTLIHEFVHAYIKTSGSSILLADHDIIAAKYITPMAAYLVQYFNIPLKEAYALAWSGVPDSKAWIEASLDFEFTMSDGDKITKQETMNLSGPYKLSTSDLDNKGYTKGTKICD